MREIKFRAWDTNYKLMSPVEYLTEKGVSIYQPQPCGEDGSDIDWSADFVEFPTAILMQYTGLKDKNGTEIYEGDIVLKPTGTIKAIKDVEIDGEIYKAYQSNPPVPYLINNLGNAFYIGTKEKPSYCGVLGNAQHNHGWELEVIGNIYENPELLEDK